MKNLSMRLPLFLFIILVPQGSSAQTVDSMIVFWKTGRVDALQSALKNHSQSKEPEIDFFRAVLDQDGSRSVLVYNKIFKDHSKSPVADDALYLSAQYDYALGFYVRAGEKLDMLIKKYPDSEYVTQAKTRFSESFTPKPVQKEKVVADSGLKSEKEWVPNNAEGMFTVQVGAFSDKSNAEALRDKLEGEGYPVELSSKIKNGKTLHLVWVGSFATPKDALILGQALKTKLGLNYGVVER